MSETSNRGIQSELRPLIHSSLLKLINVYEEVGKRDFRKVIVRQGEYSQSSQVEQYYGLQSWIEVRKRIETNLSLTELETGIRNLQPELLGYITTSQGSFAIQDVFSFLTPFCNFVLKDSETSGGIDDLVSSALTLFEEPLITGVITIRSRTLLTGILLEGDVTDIEIEPNVVLRSIHDIEYKELTATDMFSTKPYDAMQTRIGGLIEINIKLPVKLTTEPAFDDIDFSVMLHRQKQIDLTLASIHVGQTCQVTPIATIIDTVPGFYSLGTQIETNPVLSRQTIFFPLTLTLNDVGMVKAMHGKIANNRRDEINIAIGRLRDASVRSSPVDALIDSVVGLEVLLNPHDHAELSFRTALNYAFLSTKESRRKRYDDLTSLQKLRNRVVHGGLNMHSKDAALIGEKALLGKDCLRDAIQNLLEDDSYQNAVQIDAPFWLERILPLIPDAQSA